MKDKIKISERISRIVIREICEVEEKGDRETLEKWFSIKKMNRRIYQRLRSKKRFNEWNDLYSSINVDNDWELISRKIKGKEKKQKRIVWFRNMAAACVVLAIVSGAIALLLKSEKLSDKQLLATYSSPTLILDNGEAVSLNAPSQVLQLSDGDIQVSKEGKLLCEKSNAWFDKEYQLVVPRGYNYAVQLIDSSIVHLNSGSVLSFSVKEHGDKRLVALSGEGFFKVKRDEVRPFEVTVKDETIRVLGTSFNVHGYNDDDQVITTLVTGKVKISQNNNKHEAVILSPREQLCWSSLKGEVNVKEVDTEEYTSWMQGYVVFKDARLEDIMMQLSRWYDIDVDFKDTRLKDKRFGGKLYRKTPIDTNLQLIETINKIKIERNGKQVTFSN
ncbi:FecR family protein [Puteibacter caeruleilacunae]|nr:FecR family protein [Puteibacter caeruleilacunae]